MIVCSILISARSYPFTLSSCAISIFFPVHKDNQFTSVSGFISVGIYVVFGSSNLLRELIAVQTRNVVGCLVRVIRKVIQIPCGFPFMIGVK